MRNAITIARKEVRVYFGSPLFYIVTAFFLLLSGLFFALNTIQSGLGRLPGINAATIVIATTAPSDL